MIKILLFVLVTIDFVFFGKPCSQKGISGIRAQNLYTVISWVYTSKIFYPFMSKAFRSIWIGKAVISDLELLKSARVPLSVVVWGNRGSRLSCSSARHGPRGTRLRRRCLLFGGARSRLPVQRAVRRAALGSRLWLNWNIPGALAGSARSTYRGPSTIHYSRVLRTFLSLRRKKR